MVYATILFLLDVYLRDYKYFLGTNQFAEIPSNCDVETIYSARNGLDRDKALVAWSRRWAHYGGRGSAMQNSGI